MKIKQDQIIEIDWVDSIHDSGWINKDDAKKNSSEKNILHKTVGYFLQETKYSVSVFQSRGIGVENIDSTMEIPKVAIKKIKKL